MWYVKSGGGLATAPKIAACDMFIEDIFGNLGLNISGTSSAFMLSSAGPFNTTRSLTLTKMKTLRQYCGSIAAILPQYRFVARNTRL